MSKHTTITQKQSHFAQAVHADIKRSVFLRNSSRKMTFNASELVPVYIDEVLPSDTFDMNMAFLSRLTTPIFPTMDNIILDFYGFFVPNRLTWSGWEPLCGENKTGAWTPTTPPALVPQFDFPGASSVVPRGGRANCLGIPAGMNFVDFPVSVLPFRAMQLVWNEWFRDQNLQAPVPINLGNTEDSTGLQNYGPLAMNPRVNKTHDYFTSCLPEPQKGASTLIPIELNELIPVITDANIPFVQNRQHLRFRDRVAGNYPQNNSEVGVSGSGGGSTIPQGTIFTGQPTSPIGTPVLPQFLVPANLWADGRNIQISGSTISDLRTAVQIQKLYEKDARGGTRYVEMLKAHFGVEAQDYRLQRPEFLGHMRSYIGIEQVPQTSSSDNTSPQGNLAAFSHTFNKGKIFKKSFVEHGYVLIFAVARQVKTYQQGLEKFWTRKERFDFYYPTLAHISEQPVYNKEIYAFSTPQIGNQIFGYNEAWADYRYKPNTIAGQFTSGFNDTLDTWHYADYYKTRPALSDGWITDNSRENIDRTLAIRSIPDPNNPEAIVNDQFLIDIAFFCKATRPMPVNSIPGFMDHF